MMDMTQTLLPIKKKPNFLYLEMDQDLDLKGRKKKSSPCYALHTKLALVIFGCRENIEGERRMLRFEVLVFYLSEII